VIEEGKKLNEDGMRVLLVGIREFDKRDLTYSVNDEKDMILTGFIGFLDPPKNSAKESIRVIQQNNVGIKVLTGDNEIVTKKICFDVGIPSDIILLGPQIDEMNDDELQKQLEKANIMAKLSPLQKSRIIQLLKKNGHTVGFLGDGINDAPALTQADVGVSMNDASQVAIQSARVVLLNTDLHSVIKFLQISKHTLLTIKQNLFWAFFYNIIAIPIAAFGFLTPAFSALVMGLSDVVLAINSVRLFIKKVE